MIKNQAYNAERKSVQINENNNIKTMTLIDYNYQLMMVTKVIAEILIYTFSINAIFRRLVPLPFVMVHIMYNTV